MQKLLLSAFLLLMFAGCDKQSLSTFPGGSYMGTFTRTSPNTNTVTSNVSININGNTFTGTSDMEHYPAICNGSFTVEGNTLKVMNSCFFTANFDWSFIFKGDYEFEVHGEELRIFKRYPGSTTVDSYILKKVK